MAMYCFLLFSACIVASVAAQYKCDYPAIYDYSSQEDYSDFGWGPPTPTRTPPRTDRPPVNPGQHQHQHHHHHMRVPVTPSTVTSRPTPPRINSIPIDNPSETVFSRVGEDTNSMQQAQMRELYCLEVLDNLISTQWQEDIARISVTDLGNFSTLTKVPEFSNYYSNPESEWIQVEGMALNKLDKCFRNLVSQAVPRMNQDEINCLNKMYPDYLTRESRTAKMMQTYINETSREQLPFKSFYKYYEITELLFENKNIDALDGELRAIHEDMLDFYIKTEADKDEKIFIINIECEWKNARFLREVSSEDDRYRKFGQLVKSLVNRYLVSEILHSWIPGVMIPEYRYNLWMNARSTMNRKILEKQSELQAQKKDAQYLCTYAAQFATEFFDEQKAILFENMKTTALSSDLKTRKKYSYVLALNDLLGEKNDNRLSRVQVLVNEFKEGHYCLTNFVRMIENHQRWMMASTFVNEVLPYGITYCQVKDMSAGLLNPRYCKCQGTFCEQFGLANLRAERFELSLLPDGTYKLTTNSSYRVLPLDELINSANERVAQQKFNTWWYRHQKIPV